MYYLNAHVIVYCDLRFFYLNAYIILRTKNVLFYVLKRFLRFLKYWVCIDSSYLFLHIKYAISALNQCRVYCFHDTSFGHTSIIYVLNVSVLRKLCCPLPDLPFLHSWYRRTLGVFWNKESSKFNSLVNFVSLKLHAPKWSGWICDIYASSTLTLPMYPFDQ